MAYFAGYGRDKVVREITFLFRGAQGDSAKSEVRQACRQARCDGGEASIQAGKV